MQKTNLCINKHFFHYQDLLPSLDLVQYSFEEPSVSSRSTCPHSPGSSWSVGPSSLLTQIATICLRQGGPSCMLVAHEVSPLCTCDVLVASAERLEEGFGLFRHRQDCQLAWHPAPGVCPLCFLAPRLLGSCGMNSTSKPDFCQCEEQEETAGCPS